MTLAVCDCYSNLVTFYDLFRHSYLPFALLFVCAAVYCDKHVAFALCLKEKDAYLSVIRGYLEIHGTVFSEEGKKSKLPSYVNNHGILSGLELHQLLRQAKVPESWASWP